MNWRSRDLLDLAHEVHDCQFLLPGCKGYVPDGCMPIHGDGIKYGKGTGIKAEDFYHVAGCDHCHRAYENLPKAEKPVEFEPACMRTLCLYLKEGWIGVLK